MDPATRVVVPLTYGFSVRYLVPTGLLEELAAVCTPVVALGWEDPHLEELLESRGVEVARLPTARLDHELRMFRRRLGLVHERRLASPTSRIAARRRVAGSGGPRSRALTVGRRWRDRGILALPGGVRRVERDEPRQVREGSNVEEFAGWLERHDIDGALSFTPYHDQDSLLMWAARSTGRQVSASVISFDNPTTRGRLAVRADPTMVWNRHMSEQLRRADPGLSTDDVHVVGAPQFDLHVQDRWVMDRTDLCEVLGLPEHRPLLLYGASPSLLVPHEDRVVELLDEQIERWPAAERPFLVVRRHPTDPPAVLDGLASRLRNGRVVEPWAPGSNPMRSWPSDDDLTVQMSSLAHCDVHVNVCSSMTLDGAMFDRPQVGPTFVPGVTGRAARAVASLYDQEHWWPIAASGGLTLAGDPAELEAAVRAALVEPEERAVGRRRMLDDVLTFTDGRSSRRVADVLGRPLSRS